MYNCIDLRPEVNYRMLVSREYAAMLVEGVEFWVHRWVCGFMGVVRAMQNRAWLPHDSQWIWIDGLDQGKGHDYRVTIE